MVHGTRRGRDRFRARIAGLVVAGWAIGCAAACRRTPEPDPAPDLPKTSSAPQAAASAKPSRELAWDAPAGWLRVEKASPLRKATYRVPKQAGDPEDPELAVSIAGGSVDANVDRWIAQFDPSAKSTLVRSTRAIGPFTATIVELRGTFEGGGMPGAPSSPRQGWAMLAAIVPVDDEARWFFKMTGPERSVTAARPAFDALIGSVRAGS